MTASSTKKPTDETRLGIHAAQQPLSGISRVDETFAVLGNGRGGYVRKEETDKNRDHR